MDLLDLLDLPISQPSTHLPGWRIPDIEDTIPEECGYPISVSQFKADTKSLTTLITNPRTVVEMSYSTQPLSVLLLDIKKPAQDYDNPPTCTVSYCPRIFHLRVLLVL
jgi:hypothetical protein